MPAFDLRGIKVAKYSSTGYSDILSAGDAMNVNLELRYAEGRLYAEGALAEYMRLATGGTCSIGVKYIPEAVQTMMYGSSTKTRQIDGKSVSSIAQSSNDVANYVGLSFYAPDKIDGETKYTCVFLPKVSFGAPSMSYQTKGDSISFVTPTTTGEFMPDAATGQLLIETAVVDDVETAVKWCAAVLGSTGG